MTQQHQFKDTKKRQHQAIVALLHLEKYKQAVMLRRCAITVIVAANLKCRTTCALLCHRGGEADGSDGGSERPRGDALVMCPAEGDSLGVPRKDLAAGPCQPATGH